MAKVTILLPTTGGRPEYLAGTISAITAQTFPDFEVLVLDNASPTAVHARFEEWAAADPRVEIMRLDQRIPMFENFNRGVLAARGRFITFVHDDDVYGPRYLETQLDLLERHPNAGFSGSNYDFVDEHGAVTERRRWIKATEVWSGKRYITDLLSRGRNSIPMPGLVYRAEVFEGKGFPVDLPANFGDFVVLMRMAERWDLVVIEEALMGVRRHEGQASQSMPFSTAIDLRTQILKEYCAEYRIRRPRDGRFIGRLERRVEVLHRVGMMWGWLNARSEADALACADRYSAGPSRVTDDGVTRVLRSLGPAYASSRVRPRRVLELARRVSGALGV